MGQTALAYTRMTAGKYWDGNNMTIPEVHIALWLLIPIIFFVIGVIAFTVAFFNSEWHGNYIPYHSDIFVISCWISVICFLIGFALLGGPYLTRVDVVVR